jgi:hypothetical protein
MRDSNKPLLLSSEGGFSCTVPNPSMFGGFGASGGITTGKLGGGVEASVGTREENSELSAVEALADVGLFLLKEDGENGSDELALVDLRGIA